MWEGKEVNEAEGKRKRRGNGGRKEVDDVANEAKEEMERQEERE